MNSFKGAIDKNVEHVIDQAAKVAKDNVGNFMGVDKKQQQQPKPQTGAGGIVNSLTNAGNKLAADAAMNQASETALNFGKNFFK